MNQLRQVPLVASLRCLCISSQQFARHAARNAGSSGGTVLASPCSTLPPTSCGFMHRSWSTNTAGRGPVSFQALIFTICAGAGLVATGRYFQQQKVQKIMTESQKVVGKAAVGGPFELTNQDGRKFTHKDLLGDFSLLYFGFTFCPDICPAELDKMAEAIDLVESATGFKIQPVFLSVDPERDTPENVKEYVKEFHPRMIGLTGDFDSVQKVSKQYRVYFHKTSDDPDDYLVDHSIIMYLLDPEGEFVTFYGKNFDAQQLANALIEQVAKWKASHPQSSQRG